MVLALFDAVSEFVGFLEIGLTILIIKEVFGLITGGAGAGGGGISLPGWLGGRGGAAGVRDEAQALGDETRLGQGEELERREEVRETADLSAIQGLSKREITDVNRIIADIDRILKILKRGRLNAAAVQEIRQKVGEIMPSAADIRNAEQMLRLRIADLDKVETQELANLQVMVKNARAEVVHDKAAMWKSQPVERRMPLSQLKAKFEGAQTKLIDDSRKRTFAQLSSTRKRLEKHANEIAQLEGQFTQKYNQAMNYLGQPNGVPPAISSLEAAKNILKRTSKSLNELGKADVGKIWRQISTKFSELNAEKKMRGMIGKGLQQNIAVGKGKVKGRGMSMVSVFGRIRNIRIRR